MLISNETGIVNIDNFSRVYSDKELDVYINGILFCRKMKEGEESIAYVVDYLQRTGVIPFDKLYGSYTIVIDFRSNRQIIFSDNSCMHGFYISENYIGSNFCEIVKAEGCNKIDRIGACEYFSLIRGGLSRHTYVEGIGFSDNEEYYEITNSKRIKHNKNIGSIDRGNMITEPDAFFSDVVHALEDRKIICALTGGFDSRAVATCCNNVKSVDCFVSGDNDKSAEIVLAKKAARAGGYTMKHIKSAYPNIADKVLVDKWISKGGYHISFGTAEFRIDKFMDELSIDGYEVLIDGSAGDMHKEFWFTQEFPFYRKKKARPELFYNSRMKNYSSLFGESILSAIDEMEKIELSELSSLSRENNTKSCLLFGWYNDWYSMAARNTESKSPVVYSPLQEIDLVRYSYSISPRGKFMNMFLRRMISNANANVARVKTIYGTTASAELLYLIRDFFFQMLRYGQQGVRYIVRKITGKSVFLQAVDTFSSDEEVKETEIVKVAVNWAKNEGYLAKDAELDKIPMEMVDVVLNLYFIQQHCFEG